MWSTYFHENNTSTNFSKHSETVLRKPANIWLNYAWISCSKSGQGGHSWKILLYLLCIAIERCYADKLRTFLLPILFDKSYSVSSYVIIIIIIIITIIILLLLLLLLYIEVSISITRATDNSGYSVIWSARSHSWHSVNDKQWLELFNFSSEKLKYWSKIKTLRT